MCIYGSEFLRFFFCKVGPLQFYMVWLSCLFICSFFFFFFTQYIDYQSNSTLHIDHIICIVYVLSYLIVPVYVINKADISNELAIEVNKSKRRSKKKKNIEIWMNEMKRRPNKLYM